MAKKKKTTVEVETPQVEDVVTIEEPTIESPKIETKSKIETKPKPKKDNWEIKTRTYYLKNNKTPLSFQLKSSGIFYFDEEKGYERE